MDNLTVEQIEGRLIKVITSKLESKCRRNNVPANVVESLVNSCTQAVRKEFAYITIELLSQQINTQGKAT